MASVGRRRSTARQGHRVQDGGQEARRRGIGRLVGELIRRRRPFAAAADLPGVFLLAREQKGQGTGGRRDAGKPGWLATENRQNCLTAFAG